MGKTSVFETVCTEERQQSLTPSSVEGEELRAGVWGWGHWQRQRKLFITLICSIFLVVWEYICQSGSYLWRLLKLIVFLHFPVFPLTSQRCTHANFYRHKCNTEVSLWLPASLVSNHHIAIWTFFDSIPPSIPWAYREVVIAKEKKNKKGKQTNKQTTQPKNPNPLGLQEAFQICLSIGSTRIFWRLNFLTYVAE